MRLLLPIVLLAGCWPRIPGKWEDYAPGEASVMGAMMRTSYLGDYWVDSEPVTVTWVGFFDPPLDAYPWEWIADRRNGCDHDPSAAFFEDLDDIGANQLELDGPDGVDTLPYSPDERLFGSYDVAYRTEESWDLAEFESEALPTFGIRDLFATPRSFEWTSPDLDTSGMITLDRDDDVALRWSAPGADLITLEAFLFTSSGELLETIGCGLPNTGAYTLQASEFDDLDEAAKIYLVLGVFREQTGEVPGLDGLRRTIAGSRMQGAALLE